MHTIKTLCKTELAEENPLLTVDQFRVIKTAIELVACIGIIPSLLPQVKVHATTIRPKAYKLNFDNDSVYEVKLV